MLGASRFGGIYRADSFQLFGTKPPPFNYSYRVDVKDGHTLLSPFFLSASTKLKCFFRISTIYKQDVVFEDLAVFRT